MDNTSDTLIPKRKRKATVRPWLIVTLVALLAAVAWRSAQPLGPPIKLDGWNTDFNASLTLAKNSDKPLLVLFTADWCPGCHILKSDVLTNPDIDKMLDEKFVRVVIDITDPTPEQARIAMKYRVDGIPATYIMAPDAQPRGLFLGPASTDRFVQWIDTTLDQSAAHNVKPVSALLP